MSNINNEILNFNRLRLKRTETKVKNPDGTEEICKIGENGIEILSARSKKIFDGFIIQRCPDLTCNEIIPHLYLSSDDVACSLELLKKMKITHILNITLDIENLFEKENIKYKRIFIDDSPRQNIIEYFNEAFDFIDNALLFTNLTANNNVLVHCNAGVSRSASFVIGYLLKKRLFDSYKTSYDHVKQCRSKICPNKGFVEQLKKFEKKINESNI